MVLSASLGPPRVFSAPTIARFHFPSFGVGAKASQQHFYKRMSVVASDKAAAATAAAVAVPLVTENGDSRRELNPDDVLVQYVVLRRDLIDSWPLGSVVTQGCHASVAAVWLSRNDPHTVDYCSDGNLDSMHKATYLSLSLHIRVLILNGTLLLNAVLFVEMLVK
ncbi:hypothetical protein ACLOJK_036916 [Asimina triloba]